MFMRKVLSARERERGGGKEEKSVILVLFLLILLFSSLFLPIMPFLLVVGGEKISVTWFLVKGEGTLILNT